MGDVVSIKYHHPKHFGETKHNVKRSSDIGLQKEEFIILKSIPMIKRKRTTTFIFEFVFTTLSIRKCNIIDIIALKIIFCVKIYVNSY